MCTGIRLKSENNSFVYGRTLEFGTEVASNIIMIPRSYSLQSSADVPHALSWKSKYAAVGANMLNIAHVVDGINEKGLAGGLFYFPGYAEYQKVDANNQLPVIAPWELLTLCLTTCATVAEVKELLPTIIVAPIIFKKWNSVPPIHAIVHDAQGNSLVIEYVKGVLKMHHNSLGVITNSPSFDWHMTNLNNYTTINARNTQPLQLDGIMLTPFGQGSGMFGLPGDFTPPSRFVRAAFFSQAAQKAKNEYEACKTAFRILDLFNINIGLVQEDSAKGVLYDCTQWTSVSDLKNRHYYWHTYNNRQVQMVDLMRMNIAGNHIITISMEYDETASDRLNAAIDVTY